MTHMHMAWKRVCLVRVRAEKLGTPTGCFFPLIGQNCLSLSQ